ncbi:hypothetical protein V6N11_012400 [Hibiscus sabdariffa]|uniref:Uncharacterized protein n=1 Tax=Hibiscus sabdariffa TaxID=183260 RepID=A0ABR2QBC5_9ROSI
MQTGYSKASSVLGAENLQKDCMKTMYEGSKRRKAELELQGGSVAIADEQRCSLVEHEKLSRYGGCNPSIEDLMRNAFDIARHSSSVSTGKRSTRTVGHAEELLNAR